MEILRNIINRKGAFKWHCLSSYTNKTFNFCTLIIKIFILKFVMLGNSIGYYKNYELEETSLVAQMVKHLPTMQETRLGRSPEGSGNPLQYSWLENPMDGGAW